MPGTLFSVANKAVNKTKSLLSEMELLRSSHISSAGKWAKGGTENFIHWQVSWGNPLPADRQTLQKGREWKPDLESEIKRSYALI